MADEKIFENILDNLQKPIKNKPVQNKPWRYTSWANDKSEPVYKSKLDRTIDTYEARDRNYSKIKPYINKEKEEIRSTLKDLPFATARAEANKLMSFKYNGTTGRFYNENGDEVKTMKEAVKKNEELDKVLGKQNQVSTTRRAVQKKIYPGVKKQLSDLDLFYEVADPKEKAQYRRDHPDYNFVRRRFKKDLAREELLKTKIDTNIVNAKPEVKPQDKPEVPKETIEEYIKRRANERLQKERDSYIKSYGVHGIANLKIPEW